MLEVKKAISDLQQGKIEAESLANFKTQTITDRQKNLRSNGFWMRYISNQSTPFKPVELDKHDDLINSISKQDLMDFANEYLQTDTYVYATLKPEKESD